MIVLIRESPLEIIQRIDPRDDGHYDLVIDGDRIHGATVGWSASGYMLLNLLTIEFPQGGEPVGADVYVDGDSLVWAVEYA